MFNTNGDYTCVNNYFNQYLIFIIWYGIWYLKFFPGVNWV